MGKIALLAAVSFLTLGATAHAQTRLTFSTGVDYSSGDYGTEEETEVIAVPFSVRLSVNDWAFRVSAPYLQVTGPADIDELSDGSGSVTPIVREGTVRGIGDTTVAVEKAFRRIGGSSAYVEIAASARLPTGDEDKGLGIGATDYTLNTEIGVNTRGGGAYISGGYRFLGERDGVERRDNAAQAGIGGWLPAGDRVRVGAYANWREASIEGNEDPATAGVYVTVRASERLRVAFTASGGLTDASADYSTGIRFSWRPGALER